MRLMMLVLEESDRSFMSKRGPQKEYTVSLRDAGEGQRCTNNFRYALSAEEQDKFKGKLRDTKVQICVNRLRADFTGDLVIEGKLEPVTGNGKA